MPTYRPFIDRYGLIGRPYLAPDYETAINAQPQSRSLIELAKFDKQSRNIQCEIKQSRLRLDFSHALGDKVLIKKKDAIRFAQWILKSYGVKE